VIFVRLLQMNTDREPTDRGMPRAKSVRDVEDSD